MNGLARSLWLVSTILLFAAPRSLGALDNNGGKDDAAPPPFELSIHVATFNPARTEARLNRLVETAKRHFGPAEISFVVGTTETLADSFAVLETQRERHLLKRHFVQRTINVFLVDEIRDPTPSAATKKAAAWQGFKPSGRLAGAVIVHKKKAPGIYIILSSVGTDITLTHELGHLFGCAHSKDPTNIMSYGANRTHFADAQLSTFRRTAKRLRRTKQLSVFPVK